MVGPRDRDRTEDRPRRAENPLRRAPGAPAGPGGGRADGGGGVPRRRIDQGLPARAHAGRARPGRRRRSGAVRRRARRRGEAVRALLDRHRADAREGGSTSPSRAPRLTPTPGALPEVEPGARDHRGPRPPRLHRQRDRGAARRRAGADRSPRRPRRPRRRRSCASFTRSRSPTTRRGRCAAPVTPPGSASRSSRARSAGSGRPTSAPSRPTGSTPSCGGSRSSRSPGSRWGCSTRGV